MYVMADENNNIIEYPSSIGALRSRYPNVCFPAEPEPEQLAEFGFHQLTIVSPPNPGFEYDVTEGTPVYSNGNWTQTWVVTPANYETKMAHLQTIQAGIVVATQARLDTFAQTRNYDGILSACTYANSSVPKFATEGQYCVDMRDQTWATLYEILAEVQAGTRPYPNGFADVEPDLPALTWPN